MDFQTFDPAKTNPACYQKAASTAPPDIPEDTPQSITRAPLTIRGIDEILAMPENPADLILANGYLERGERTVICGMGGIGKSRLIMQMAMMHRAGLPFLAWETRSADLRWLFLQTENGIRRLKSDLTAMLQAFTSDQQAKIKAGIAIHTLEEEDDGFLTLSDQRNQERAIRAVESSKADIVVFDPLRDFTGDDLNKDAAMSSTLRQIRCVTRAGNPQRTCIIIHHAGEGKSAAAKATGYDRGAFGRNSKVLKTWARAQFNIAPATPDDNSRIIIASGKCNNHEEFSPICARLNPETLIYEVVENFDLDEWRESLVTEKQKPSTGKLISIIQKAGGELEKTEAIKRMGQISIGKHTAHDLIKQAINEGLMEESKKSRPGKKPAILLTLKT